MGLYPSGGLFPSGLLYPGAPETITETEEMMLSTLPPILQGSLDYQSIIRACAREIDLLEASLEIVRRQADPAQADVLLDAWEYELKLPVGGAGAPTPQRRAAVLARLRKVVSGGTGREWEQAITNILGPGWSYLEHDPGDPSSPADGVIQITVPFASGTSDFAEAQNQVRDLTDAHLEIEFLSTAPFLLDSSQMDVNEFGA